MGSECGSDRLIQVLFCKFDPCKYPLTKAGATPDGPEFASSGRIFRLVSPAGAGTRRYENWVHWSMEGFGCGWCHPSPLDSRFRGNDGACRRFGRRVFSYQSLIPAGAGTSRYEEPELWLGAANWHGGFCHAPPRTQRGTSSSPREVFDRATFSHSALGPRSTIRHVSPLESRRRD